MKINVVMIVTGSAATAVDQYNALENIPLTDVVCYFFYLVFSKPDENVVLGSLGGKPTLV